MDAAWIREGQIVYSPPRNKTCFWHVPLGLFLSFIQYPLNTNTKPVSELPSPIFQVGTLDHLPENHTFRSNSISYVSFVEIHSFRKKTQKCLPPWYVLLPWEVADVGWNQVFLSLAECFNWKYYFLSLSWKGELVALLLSLSPSKKLVALVLEKVAWGLLNSLEQATQS